jgi:hypothetical protein
MTANPNIDRFHLLTIESPSRQVPMAVADDDIHVAAKTSIRKTSLAAKLPFTEQILLKFG